MKKIIIYLTIFSLLNLVGCYYQQQMTPEEYNFDEKLDLQVTTKDTIYSLSAEDYYYYKDTLFATVSKFMYKDDYWIRYKTATKIPVKDIEKLEIEKIDEAATTWIVVGVVVIAAAVIVNFARGDYGIDF
ncbi:MAG: hypothetical protein EHM44_11700 [Ignavibacteriales bacterium]|nr:MAG: hypothetical protein EHM44_11700 [Ignavibacteriales bacterium]